MGDVDGLTSSQTVGPFFHLALDWPTGAEVVAEGTPGAMWIRGTVRDGAGDPVPDALIETWQPDADGRFDHPDAPDDARHSGFCGFGRCPTDADGRWAVRTVKPGRVALADGRLQAPYIAVSVFARGLLDRVVTRIYFGDEEEANAADPLLSALAPALQETLVAVPVDDGYRFDVHLQGEHETVFVAV
jgi:protocatechuate 3,4-dioxygenase alpha subunit